MKLRERLARIKNIAVWGQIGSFALMACAIIVFGGTGADAFAYIALVAAAVFLGCMAFGKHGARCPRCRQNIGSRTQYFGDKTSRWFRRIDFCLFCGVSLDEPAP